MQKNTTDVSGTDDTTKAYDTAENNVNTSLRRPQKVYN